MGAEGAGAGPLLAVLGQQDGQVVLVADAPAVAAAGEGSGAYVCGWWVAWGRWAGLLKVPYHPFLTQPTLFGCWD